MANEIRWDEPHNVEGDQHGETAVVGHGYWAIGPQDLAGELWSAELIQNNEAGDEITTGGVALGQVFPGREAAKAAAQAYEDANCLEYAQLHAECSHGDER
ncbi:Uncharacterised protein [Mycobacteroides abscessus subsp. abscessus]|uniref:hypothetical protein n=1 Tax=Mycobacteroides abscessus TaxID=36809 RepID=UPI000928688A|nr:hypothetical protein [Mycobacteroides abscessus]SIH25099.1 Uncharacterised protein [Mycobacteroides abscessus subsp. abscessus]